MGASLDLIWYRFMQIFVKLIIMPLRIVAAYGVHYSYYISRHLLYWALGVYAYNDCNNEFPCRLTGSFINHIMATCT